MCWCVGCRGAVAAVQGGIKSEAVQLVAPGAAIQPEQPNRKVNCSFGVFERSRPSSSRVPGASAAAAVAAASMQECRI